MQERESFYYARKEKHKCVHPLIFSQCAAQLELYRLAHLEHGTASMRFNSYIW